MIHRKQLTARRFTAGQFTGGAIHRKQLTAGCFTAGQFPGGQFTAKKNTTVFVHYNMYSNAFAPPAMSFDPILGHKTIQKVGELRLE
jgi:hypothetical protein